MRSAIERGGATLTVTNAGDEKLSVSLVGRRGRTILYLVTEDWYFLSHRLPMALAAQRAGYRVHVATRVQKGAAEIEAHGFRLHPLEWRRGSTNPADLVSMVRQVRTLYKALKPDLAHHVGLQASIVGSLAARGLPLVAVNAMTGLGFAFVSRSRKARLLRPFFSARIRLLIKGPKAVALVQNPDDRAALVAIGVKAAHIALVPGSGVDVGLLVPLLEPQGEVTVAFVGRLLEDKGVRTLLDAHQLMMDHGETVRLLIAGDPDEANPSSITQRELVEWRSRPQVELLGHVDDIRDIWARAHIAVLPSRREGLPLSLLEAAACARPIVASDVPGCREIARHDVNAFLVPVDDPQSLAAALSVLARDPALRRRLGVAGRQLVVNEFSDVRIGAEIVALYDRQLNIDAGPLPLQGEPG
jgi:glycosyltransferase involved in cell wall biosynthesis